MTTPLDIKGQTFNRLTALHVTRTNKYGSRVWLFQCSCGKTTEHVAYEVKSHKIKSCGCWNSEVTANRNRARRIHPNKKSKQLKADYGLVISDYYAMLQSQNGVCAICEKPQEGKCLAVDHNHVTGEVRGLLCECCNKALGQFKDDVSLLEKAINYLGRFQ